jgi:hypothetical protein
MSSSEFKVISDFHLLSTREGGASARNNVLCALETSAVVTLDFTGARPSPSFADELVGGLASKLGRDAFLRRVRIIGIDDAVRALLNHIVTTRLKQIRSTSDSNTAQKSNGENRGGLVPA